MRNDRILRNTFYVQLIALIISSLSATIGSLVDGIIIGQYLGSDSIAAFGIINPLLPASFDVSEENQMEGSIVTMDEAAAMSVAVWDFCTKHNCDERRRNLLALCVEEMTTNIITHGFSQDKREHSISVRVIKKEELYIVRIRDDCLIFDPLNQLAIFSEEDPTRHIGLRMVAKLAKEMQYTNILKLNKLLIKI